MCRCGDRSPPGEVRQSRIPPRMRGAEEKAKIELDLANKKRNTSACFEVGDVSSSFLIDGGYSYPSAPRITNHCKTLS